MAIFLVFIVSGILFPELIQGLSWAISQWALCFVLIVAVSWDLSSAIVDPDSQDYYKSSRLKATLINSCLIVYMFVVVVFSFMQKDKEVFIIGLILALIALVRIRMDLRYIPCFGWFLRPYGKELKSDLSEDHTKKR